MPKESFRKDLRPQLDISGLSSAQREPETIRISKTITKISKPQEKEENLISKISKFLDSNIKCPVFEKKSQGIQRNREV